MAGIVSVSVNCFRYSVDSDGTLRIQRVDADDSGVYMCVAENNVDRVSHSFRVFVQGWSSMLHLDLL